MATIGDGDGDMGDMGDMWVKMVMVDGVGGGGGYDGSDVVYRTKINIGAGNAPILIKFNMI